MKSSIVPILIASVLMASIVMAPGSPAPGSFATNYLRMENLSGWKITTTSVYGGSTDASVAQTTDYSVRNFKFRTGAMNVSWVFQWASLSSDAFAHVPLSAVTSVRIRNYGVSGDNSTGWQPPTFTWVMNTGGSNQRCIAWKPWANGNSRAPGAWQEYDAATTGQWYVQETVTYYNSLAALQTALPTAYFEATSQLPVDYGYASQHAFNVGNCPLYDGDRQWFSNASGYVDWFEIGISNKVVRYELGNASPARSNLVCAIAGTALRLSWPTDHIGWSLQVQTNTLSAGLGTNWVTIPGYESTNLATIPMSRTNAIFYRLTYTP